MTLRRKILLATVLALVPVAALLRWNHRGRAICDGVERASVAFAENLEATGDFVSSWDEATDAFGKRQDILGARWIERGNWRIRVTSSLNEQGWHALRAWHEGKLVFDTCERGLDPFVVDFPECAGARNTEGKSESPDAFTASFGFFSRLRYEHRWIVSPFNAVYLRECDDIRWDFHPDTSGAIVEARHHRFDYFLTWTGWLVYRINPQTGIQLLAEDNRLPEPSDEWVHDQIARSLADPAMELQDTATQLLISGQWRAVGTLARRLERRSEDQTWAAWIDETIGNIELENRHFKPMFNAYRAEMGTPWHEPGASARKPAAAGASQ